MKGIILFILLFLLLSPVWAQETPNHQYSDAPETSRYQIIQSELGVRLTFKIDKYLGEVYLLVKGEDDRLTWESMIKEEHPFDEAIQNQEKVNYQIFTSGLGIKFTFLINVNTGATWQLVEDTEDKLLFWTPVSRFGGTQSVLRPR